LLKNGELAKVSTFKVRYTGCIFNDGNFFSKSIILKLIFSLKEETFTGRNFRDRASRKISWE